MTSSSVSFKIGDRQFSSRLFLGTAGFQSDEIMLEAIKSSGCEMVTVAIRRIALKGESVSLKRLLMDHQIFLLPNTSGCYTAQDAVLTARLAQEALETSWIKLEVIGRCGNCQQSGCACQLLYPDVGELIESVRILAKEGFTVLAYCNDDPITCRKLADVGAAAVMPLGSPIGSGLGILNPYMIERICSYSPVPVVLDAGIGTASDAALAMELGCSAVLVNTSVSKAQYPLLMAKSMKAAVVAGRLSYEAGRIPELYNAEPSSPKFGLIGT